MQRPSTFLQDIQKFFPLAPSIPLELQSNPILQVPHPTQAEFAEIQRKCQEDFNIRFILPEFKETFERGEKCIMGLRWMEEFRGKGLLKLNDGVDDSELEQVIKVFKYRQLATFQAFHALLITNFSLPEDSTPPFQEQFNNYHESYAEGRMFSERAVGNADVAGMFLEACRREEHQPKHFFGALDIFARYPTFQNVLDGQFRHPLNHKSEEWEIYILALAVVLDVNKPNPSNLGTLQDDNESYMI